MDFTNKVILLTGSSSGIGLATAKALLSLSGHVFGVDVNPPTDPELLAYTSPTEQSSALPGKFHFHAADLSASSSIPEIVKECVAIFGGRIDVLLNVAGIMDSFSSVGTVSEGELQKVLAVNLVAPIRLMGGVVGIMREQKGGVIVNVASRAGATGATAGVSYTTSKWGLIGASKQTAFRYQTDNIRVNCVSPGGVTTNIMQNSGMDPTKFDVESYQTMKPFMDMGGLSEAHPPMPPEDIANGIVWLASDLAKSISGTVLPIDRGWSAA